MRSSKSLFSAYDVEELQNHFLFYGKTMMGTHLPLLPIFGALILAGGPLFLWSCWICQWTRYQYEVMAVIGSMCGAYVLLVASVANMFRLRHRAGWVLRLNQEGEILEVTRTTRRWFHYWAMGWHQKIVLSFPEAEPMDAERISAFFYAGRAEYLRRMSHPWDRS